MKSKRTKIDVEAIIRSKGFYFFPRLSRHSQIHVVYLRQYGYYSVMLTNWDTGDIDIIGYLRPYKTLADAKKRIKTLKA